MQNPDEPQAQDDTGPRRAIYLLPNLFTTAAMFAGFFAIIAAMGGRFSSAAIAIIIAGVLDGLDGRIARMTNTQSDFGKEYDSMSDLVSFGLAPALVMYQWALEGMASYGWLWSKVGWLAAFFYAVCAAMRLARFNTQAGVVDRRYFVGLASPAAAGLLATFVWVGHDFGFEGSDLVIPALLFTVLAGALMVSRVNYYSFKDLNLGQRVSFPMLILVPLVFILIALNPPKVLFLMGFSYVASGPAIELWRIYRRRRSAGAA
ncbi:MAG: CDP-diacylglycerol--serine O-phosphatidyltransferase [Xanthomonadaceae bacterium]|nr:CDP-diacylglycerol--serine O-phosphatidyltransferase [Xanthomonadaceae bacterium]